jgi:hypothetical protein
MSGSKSTGRKTGKKIQGKGWKKAITISGEKYEIVSKAVLKSLGEEPVRFTELAAKVKKQLPKFPGSVSWYTVSTLRALENEGKIARIKGKVVTYHKS